MSTVPIPQGAKIADVPSSIPSSIPIPDSAIVEQSPGKGVTTDSMDADYQFKHPALTDEENKQLKAANLSRPLYRKLLGLPANDSVGAALEEKDLAHQTESAQHSSYVQQQLTDKAVGGAVVAAAPAVAGSANAALAAAGPMLSTVGPPLGTAVGTVVKLANTPVGKYILKTAGTALGTALGLKWLGKI